MKKFVFSSLIALLVISSLITIYCFMMSIYIISSEKNIYTFDIGQKYLIIFLISLLLNIYLFFKVNNFIR
jgi:hypothetical protein